MSYPRTISCYIIAKQELKHMTELANLQKMFFTVGGLGLGAAIHALVVPAETSVSHAIAGFFVATAFLVMGIILWHCQRQIVEIIKKESQGGKTNRVQVG